MLHWNVKVFSGGNLERTQALKGAFFDIVAANGSVAPDVVGLTEVWTPSKTAAILPSLFSNLGSTRYGMFPVGRSALSDQSREYIAIGVGSAFVPVGLIYSWLPGDKTPRVGGARRYADWTLMSNGAWTASTGLVAQGPIYEHDALLTRVMEDYVAPDDRAEIFVALLPRAALEDYDPLQPLGPGEKEAFVRSHLALVDTAFAVGFTHVRWTDKVLRTLANGSIGRVLSEAGGMAAKAAHAWLRERPRYCSLDGLAAAALDVRVANRPALAASTFLGGDFNTDVVERFGVQLHRPDSTPAARPPIYPWPPPQRRSTKQTSRQFVAHAEVDRTNGQPIRTTKTHAYDYFLSTVRHSDAPLVTPRVLGGYIAGGISDHEPVTLTIKDGDFSAMRVPVNPPDPGPVEDPADNTAPGMSRRSKVIAKKAKDPKIKRVTRRLDE